MTVGLNRVGMFTATTGTGTITLGSAISGYATVAEAGGVNATAYTYLIEEGSDFEIGTGTYTSSGTTLSRDTVTLSKISGTAGTSKINLAGAARVYITVKDNDLISPTSTDTLTNKTLTSPSLITSALLSSGFVFNWNSSDVLLAHSANALAFSGASSGYSFDTFVGIGGSPTSGALLDIITGGGTTTGLKINHSGSDFIVRPASSGGDNTVIENTSGGALIFQPSNANAGGVVVGHTEPLETYVGNNNFPGCQQHGTNFSTASFWLVRWANVSGSNAFQLSKSRSGTVGSYTVVQSGDQLGVLLFTGDDGTGFVLGAKIQAEVDGTPGTNDMPGRLLFFTTADGASSATERMRIDSKGNVRINTAAVATTATDGFLYIPTCAGTPTGTPTTVTGLAPIVVDSTNNKLYFYSGGSWRDAGP